MAEHVIKIRKSNSRIDNIKIWKKSGSYALKPEQGPKISLKTDPLFENHSFVAGHVCLTSARLTLTSVSQYPTIRRFCLLKRT